MNLPQVGATGYLLEPLFQAGYVVVDGATYPALSQGESLDTDQCVVVVGHDEGRLVVRAATDDEARRATQAAPRRELPTPAAGGASGGRAGQRTYTIFLGILGVALAPAVGILVVAFWAFIVVGHAHRGPSPGASFGDLSSPFAGLIATGIGLIVLPILGVRLGSRLDR